MRPPFESPEGIDMYGDSFFESMDIHLSVSKRHQNTRRYVDIHDLCNTLILFDILTKYVQTLGVSTY